MKVLLYFANSYDYHIEKIPMSWDLRKTLDPTRYERERV